MVGTRIDNGIRAETSWSRAEERMTKNRRMLTLLTLVNLGILSFLLLHQRRIVEASGALPVLRGSGLEIVDAQGKVRASIQLVPAGPAIRADGSVAKDGKIYPETVRFRLGPRDGSPL